MVGEAVEEAWGGRGLELSPWRTKTGLKGRSIPGRGEAPVVERENTDRNLKEGWTGVETAVTGTGTDALILGTDGLAGRGQSCETGACPHSSRELDTSTDTVSS